MPAVAPPPPTLEASPFVLRPLADGDVALYAALFADPDVMRAVGPAFTRDRAERAAASALRHQHEANGRHRHWVIAHGDEGAGLLGLALRGTTWRGGEAELGVLLWPAWQARGAATGAIRAVRRWAFEIAGLATLTCHHARGHAGADALMRRVGFTPTAARADAPFPCGWACHRDAAAALR